MNSRDWPLTDLGWRQARATGLWVKDNLLCSSYDLFGIDYWVDYFSSPFTRARETATGLELVRAHWRRVFELRERDSGADSFFSRFTETPPTEDDARSFVKEYEERTSFRTVPEGGQSYVNKCVEVGTVLREMLDCRNYRREVIMVSHGDTILSFRFIIEGLSRDVFVPASGRRIDDFRILNCQIVHYTRRSDPNKNDSTICDGFRWMRYVRPTFVPVRISPWKELNPIFTSKELEDRLDRLNDDS